MRLPLRTALAAGITLLAACGGSGDADGPRATLSVTRTTAGDTTVVHIAGVAGASDSLRLVEAWRTGSGDGSDTTEFSAIYEIARADDGTLYVLDGQTNEIFRLDADGTPRGLVGRRGGGPGEYTQVSGITVLPDGALAVWDGGGSRVVIFAADGTARATFPSPVTGFFTSNGLTADTTGRLWMSGFRRVDEARDSTVPLHIRFTADGTVLDSLERPRLRPDGEIVRVERNTAEGRTSMAFGVPFAPSHGNAVERRGTHVRWPGEPYVIVADRADGVLRIEREVVAVPVPEAQREADRARLERNAQRVDPSYRATFTIPDTKPPVGSVRPGADGTLWVSVATPSTELPPAEGDTTNSPRFRSPQGYDVYAHDGTPIGSVLLPPGARLLAATRTMAWGTVLDDDDVPSVVAWRVVPMETDAR